MGVTPEDHYDAIRRAHLAAQARLTARPTREGRAGDTQPMPIATNGPVIHSIVAADLMERLRIGVERYGQPLQPFNGRDALRDAYDEVLDLAVYLRQEIYERDGR